MVSTPPKWRKMVVQKLKLKRSTKLQQHKHTSTSMHEEHSLLKTSVIMAMEFNQLNRWGSKFGFLKISFSGYKNAQIWHRKWDQLCSSCVKNSILPGNTAQNKVCWN